MDVTTSQRIRGFGALPELVEFFTDNPTADSIRVTLEFADSTQLVHDLTQYLPPPDLTNEVSDPLLLAPPVDEKENARRKAANPLNVSARDWKDRGSDITQWPGCWV